MAARLPARKETAARALYEKALELQVAAAKAESAQARTEMAQVKAESSAVAGSRDQAQAALRLSAGGDLATAAQQRAEKAERDLRDVWILRDRLERTLAAKDSELRGVQKEYASFQAVAMATLPRIGLRGELQRLETEVSNLLKQANELAEPSSAAPWESRQIQRSQIMSQVEFKRRLVNDIVQRCK